MREALLLCCMITVKCIPSLILVICFLGPTVRNPVDGLQCLPLTSWTSCWWRTEWNTIKVYSLAKVLTLGLVKQQISIWTNTKAFIFQSLQSVCAKQFGGSSPQGATGDRQGKSSTGNHFRQVVLIRVSKVFRAHTGGRLARKLILDLKARANNYQRAKRLSKKIAGKGEINHTWAAPVVEQMTLQMPPLLPPTHSSAENLRTCTTSLVLHGGLQECQISVWMKGHRRQPILLLLVFSSHDGEDGQQRHQVCCSAPELSPWPPCSVASELWAGGQHATTVWWTLASERGLRDGEQP